jgi:hypothetical protein
MSRTTTADPSLIPDIEAFEERVAIHIHEGGIPTDQAKDLAAQAQGFRSQAHYWAWLRVYVGRKRLGRTNAKKKPVSQSGGLGMLFYFLRRWLG